MTATPGAAAPPGAAVRVRPVRWATRAVFFVLGAAVAAWAPVVPYAKARVGADDATLGLLILCLGLGSLTTMPVAGWLVGRFGCRLVLPVFAAAMCLSLPLLGLAATPLQLGAALLLFGATVGGLDVGINIQAVAVEQAERRPLMSGFHGQFSLGGIAGAGLATGLLALGLPAPVVLAATGAVALVVLAAATPQLLPRVEGRGGGPAFVLPPGPVLLLGMMCFVGFMAEGAVLDWSALFLTDERGVDPAWGGIAYAAFSTTMTAGRLLGDRIVACHGGLRVVVWGALAAAAGYLVVIGLPGMAASIAGFALIGAGAANVVPVLFTAAGRQAAVPAETAVAGVATLGYLGLLVGPALIGFVAHASTLATSFGLVALLLVSVGMAAKRAISGGPARAE
ncbi:MFS transporter [Alsobacter sp. R-9]